MKLATPSFCKNGHFITACLALPADLETPVSAYLKLSRQSAYSFLLESVDQVEKWGRYSFLGAEPEALISCTGRRISIVEGKRKREFEVDDPIAYLRQELARNRIPPLSDLPPFQGGYIGYLGYDCVRFFERLPATLPVRKDAPDFFFMKVMSFVVFDTTKQTLMLVAHAALDPDKNKTQAERAAKQKASSLIHRLLSKLDKALSPAEKKVKVPSRTAPFKSQVKQGEYCKGVERIKSYIRAGDVFQCVYSMEFTAKGIYDPASIYRVLRTLNPSPYLYVLRLGTFSVVGSSPEIMVRKDGEVAIVRPIAGTRRRGKTPQEDLALEAELCADPKENAEHIMLVDLGRNDLGRVSRAGTLKVSEERVVERYSHVMHLVSEVTGQLKEGADAFDLVASTFPAGTLSGAPKVRAMEIIEELEDSRRGIYGGAVGYIGFDGNVDMAIAIRTVVVHPEHVVLRAGAGIVQDSIPVCEFEECANKARALIKACEQLKR